MAASILCFQLVRQPDRPIQIKVIGQTDQPSAQRPVIVRVVLEIGGNAAQRPDITDIRGFANAAGNDVAHVRGQVGAVAARARPGGLDGRRPQPTGGGSDFIEAFFQALERPAKSLGS